MYPNKFPGTCQNQTCKSSVPAMAGFIQKSDSGKYIVWCQNCVPERKGTTVTARRILTTDGKIIVPFEQNNLDLIRSIPGARWDKVNKWWNVSLDMADRRRLLEVADRIGLEVPDSLRAIAITEEAQNATNAGLYPYQIEGVNFLAHKDRALLGDEMGLGKTVQSLMGVPLHNGSAMVICRAGLKYNWLDEVKKWRPDLKPVVLNTRKSFRWPNQGEVIVINNELLPDEFNTPKRNRGEVMQAYWDRLRIYRETLKANHPQAANLTLIVDEAHDYKNREAARSRKVKEFVRLSNKLIGLTGSPLTNRPEDLFGVLDVLGLATQAFGSWERFQTLFDCHIQPIRNGYRTINKIVWGKPKPVVSELLRRVMIRRLRADVLPDLPKKTYTNLTVGEMDDSLQKSMDALWEEWGNFIEIEGELPPFEKMSQIRAELAKSRIPAMLEYVENAEEQDCPLVVFAAHLAPLDALIGREGWALITGDTKPERRQEIVRAFQAGQLKGVGVSIHAGGVGINLTHAWKALFVDLDWTPAANWQAEDRIARIGQKSNKVEIVRMVSDHPLDIHIQNMLVDKIDTIIRAIDTAIEGEKIQSKDCEDESEEEFQLRMKKLVEQADAEIKERKEKEAANRKAVAKTKVSLIHAREKMKAKGTVLPLIPERITGIRTAFKHMLSVCDGAIMKDGVGFNKPDASIGHWLLSAGLETDEEVEAAYFMLTRYHRQLSGSYPILFKGA